MPTRQLSLLGLMFGLFFLTLVFSALIPFKPADPLWVLRAVDTSLRSSWLALIAVALVELGAFLDPEDPLLERRQQRFSRLALAACLIFLLMIPAQLLSGMRKFSGLRANEIIRIAQAERKLAALRQAVELSGSHEEMQQRFQQLQGPKIGPAPSGLPIAQIRARVSAALNQAQTQISREKTAIGYFSALALVTSTAMREIVTCVLLAFSFAIFARLPGSSYTLIEELPMRWRHHSATRTRASIARSEDDLLREIELEDQLERSDGQDEQPGS